MRLNGLPSILSPQSHECLPFEQRRGARGWCVWGVVSKAACDGKHSFRDMTQSD